MKLLPGTKRIVLGFSLLELTVVLAVIAAIMGGALAMFNASLEGKAYNATVDRLKILQKALADYRLAYNRLPCPANYATYATTVNNFGLEAANKGSCTGGTPASDIANANVAIGMVPVRTLGLPDEMAIDSYGRRIRYAVSPAFTIDNAFDGTGATAVVTSTTTRLTVTNNESGTDLTTTALYVLVSHGKNGHGGRGGTTGTLINTASANASELINCKCTNAGVFDNTVDKDNFVQGRLKPDPDDTLNDFDDVVVFANRVELRDADE